MPVSITVNGERREEQVPARLTLADFLRDTLGLTGTHLGCEHGICGSCTIHLDGAAVRSCLLLAAQADGREVATVESLGGREDLHPLQRAFSEAHALQCEFYTPGMLMTAAAFLREEPSPTPEAAREAIAGNLCRCTGYAGIVEAIVEAAGP